MEMLLPGGMESDLERGGETDWQEPLPVFLADRGRSFRIIRAFFHSVRLSIPCPFSSRTHKE